MNKQISYKIVSLFFGILVICFAIAFYAFGVWTEPSSAPPGNNVDPPLNVSAIGQVKEGGLLIHNSSEFANPAEPYGLIVRYGRVGVGIVSPSEKLDVSGNIVASGTICDSTGCIGSGGGGDITAVNAGTGLTGGGTIGDIILDVDINYLQRRVTDTCGAESSIRVINEDGTVICETDDVNGTVGHNDCEWVDYIQSGPVGNFYAMCPAGKYVAGLHRFQGVSLKAYCCDIF